MRPGKYFGKTSSELPLTLTKSSYLATYTQRRLHTSTQPRPSVTHLKSEISTATELAMNCLEKCQKKNELKFGDISSITIKETDHSDTESVFEFDKLLASPVQKRDLNKFARTKLKYSVKVTKTVISSPKKTIKSVCQSKPSGLRSLVKK